MHQGMSSIIRIQEGQKEINQPVVGSLGWSFQVYCMFVDTIWAEHEGKRSAGKQSRHVAASFS